MSDYGNGKRKCKRMIKGIRELDMFNKDITLYYKGKDQSDSIFGSILTILYISIYVAFFIYKSTRLFKKLDLSIYESEIMSQDPPSIELNNDIFYQVFSLKDPENYEPILDETIYTVKGLFKRKNLIKNIIV